MRAVSIFLALFVLLCVIGSAQGRRGGIRAREEGPRVFTPVRPQDSTRPEAPSARSHSLQPVTPSLPVRTRQPDRQRSSAGDYRVLFEKVEHGISGGNVGEFSQHFASQVMINLRGAESGYLSANQAYYVLENYFKTRKVVNLSFSTIGESELNPYATGSAGLNVKGGREVAQVYVSLSFTGGRWVITQLNIY